MIDRENLVKAIYDNNEQWSCPSTDTCAATCMQCAEKLLKEYEGKIITSFEYSITSKIKTWYFDTDKQALVNDPCVVDALIDLFIREVHDTANAMK